MKRFIFILVMMVLGGGRAFGISMDQGKPGENVPGAGAVDPHATVGMGNGTAAGVEEMPYARPEFERDVQLDRFRLLAVQHRDQVKILDSWARQTLSAIRNRETIDGQDPLYSVLDIAIRRDAWMDQNIIYVQAIPIREQLLQFAGSELEKDRILHTGLVSPTFLDRPEVTGLLDRIGLDTRLNGAVTKVEIALNTFKFLDGTMMIIPPDAGSRGMPWRLPIELMGNFPESDQRAMGLTKKLPPLPGYTADQSRRVKLGMDQMTMGWATGDAKMVNAGLNGLADVLPTIDPEGYPSVVKRTTELWYNRMFYGTVANVFLYFIAMTLFLMVGVGAVKRLERPALTVFTVAVIFHFASLAVRCWLAERWPTQNEFESIMASAFLGCLVGLLLEAKLMGKIIAFPIWCFAAIAKWTKMRELGNSIDQMISQSGRKGLFGMAFSFVGFLAMTGCMAAPYFSGRDIGGSIEKVAGILQTYWLYIHVNVVISSYALIGASFVMAMTYLGMRLWYWVNPVEPGIDDETRSTKLNTQNDGGVAEPALALNVASAVQIERSRAERLETLDQANMVILQMAFWFLGIGIICGAVWADQSWGRPWGWDPKETFALVTWIVYLIIVHARFVTRAKGDVTAWMAVAGFAVMMFNWIGVNFWLAGLHSYA